VGDKMMNDPRVAVAWNPCVSYPLNAPFHPSEEYPEYPFSGRNFVNPSNRVYAAVRDSLHLLGLDEENFGKQAWNPLKSLVRPGDRVVIKPNAVLDINHDPAESVFAVITHGSVIRAILDYVFIALEGQGQITIADAPLAHSDFRHWQTLVGMGDIQSFYENVAQTRVQVLDLRTLYVPWDYKSASARSELREVVARDPCGYIEVDLGDKSEFGAWSVHDIERLYGSDFRREDTINHHSGGHHRYFVSGTVLEADVFIALPKLKTHKKVGVTLTMKGMVGTQGDKNYIPHHRIGSPRRGGDEYPDTGLVQESLSRCRLWLYGTFLSRHNKRMDRVYRFLFPLLQGTQRLWDRVNRFRYEEYGGCIEGGNWCGNDTAWRMALDLTRIVACANKSGALCDSPQRRFFALVDGIVAGQGEGPLAPQARHCGLLVAGFNPLAVDAVAARLMGFDPNRIMMLSEGAKRSWLKSWQGGWEKVQVSSNQWLLPNILLDKTHRFLQFTPPHGWKEFMEIDPYQGAIPHEQDMQGAEG